MSYDDEHGFGDTDRGDVRGVAAPPRYRYPDDEAGHRSGRRPGRAPSSRNLVMIVGVVVLLLAAIAFANRGGDGAKDDTGASGPEASATAPTGERPVDGKAAGIPTGFARSEAGAQSAAVNYHVALGSDGMYRSDRRTQIARAVYAPAVVEDRLKSLDEVYSSEKFLTSIGLEADGTAPEGQTFISRFNPVGSKVEEYGGDSARVSVWYSALFGLAGEGSKNPVSESWYTNTFDLTWVDGNWKITDFTQKDGPVPVGRDQAASDAEDMAAAVEQYGGFTYAR
ncbi:hypothetical protein [Streptomyces sp. NPDC060194]|uniref:hypothetical protein n=1 Tax=Streptomyces sp. NPDC060194 TaxID=3347069 RepID=UPI00364C74B6